MSDYDANSFLHGSPSGSWSTPHPVTVTGNHRIAEHLHRDDLVGDSIRRHLREIAGEHRLVRYAPRFVRRMIYDIDVRASLCALSHWHGPIPGAIAEQFTLSLIETAHSLRLRIRDMQRVLSKFNISLPVVSSHQSDAVPSALFSAAT